MRLAWIAVALLACAKAEEGAPVLRLDTAAHCDGSVSCASDGAESLDLDGVRVLHKQLPGHPMVALLVQFDAETSSGRQAWAEELALSLFQRSGSNQFESSDWDSRLLHLGATVNVLTGPDYSSIAGLAPLPRWRELWDLIITGLIDPNINDYDLSAARARFQRAYATERDDPENASQVDAWTRLFRGETQTFERQTLDVLAQVSIEDLSRAWNALLRSRRVLVTVVGDVDPAQLEEAARALSATLFSDAAPAFPAGGTGSVPSSPDIAILPYPDAPTWYIDAYFKGPGGAEPDYAALSLGLRVLDARLFRDIRDERGLAYTTGAASSFYRQSYGHIWVSTRQPREALPVLRQALADLKSLGPDPEELEAARAGIRTGLLASGDDPWSLALTLADWQLTTGSTEELAAYLDAIDQMQPATVAAALDAYLRNVKIAAAGGGSPLEEADLNTVFVSP